MSADDLLTDPRFTMPPVPDGGPVPGIRWLRRSVARFADGGTHHRRRLLVTDLLATVDLAALRASAAERTRAVLAEGGSVARTVPVEVLAAAMGLPPVPAETVAVVAAAYQPGTGEEEQADQAVAQLVTALRGDADEVTAAKICVLVQACAATAGLIDNATGTTTDPPVRATRRRSPGTGSIVTVDLTGRPFGAGPHECPGQAHAMAITDGVLSAR